MLEIEAIKKLSNFTRHQVLDPGASYCCARRAGNRKGLKNIAQVKLEQPEPETIHKKLIGFNDLSCFLIYLCGFFIGRDNDVHRFVDILVCGIEQHGIWQLFERCHRALAIAPITLLQVGQN